MSPRLVGSLLVLLGSEALVPPSGTLRKSSTTRCQAAMMDPATTLAVAPVAEALGRVGELDYASALAATAAATCGATLPVVALVGRRAMERRFAAELEVPAEAETPYPGGADSYSPAAAEAFYRRRPLLVATRLIGLLQATLSFQVKLLLDWRTGNVERNEKERAREALALVEELGPTFIKLGQALSIRTDLVPEAYALELRKLQDAVPAFPDGQAREVMRRAFGVGELEEIFEEISETSIAAASIGQVYRGSLKPGRYACDAEGSSGAVRSVAIKVRRPNVLAEICLDLYLLRLLAPFQVWVSNAVSKLPTEREDVEVALALVDEWGRGFVNEVDYFAEARNTMEFAEAMRRRGLGAVISPRVVSDLSTENVLVTEWIEGTRLDAAGSPDVPRLCGVAINAYLTMLLDTGCIHCDPHPGNLLRTLDGRLCILDWGMTLQVPPDLQYSLLEFIAHINTDDLDEIPYDFVNLGFTPPDKVDRVASSGVTDGLAFMLRQLSQGGGPAKVRERVRSEFVARYGDLDDDELRKRARAEMISRMEAQLADEGVDVRGVSNVMQEMSRRNRELFRLPEWVLYVVRAFSVLEGIGLSIDENYSILQECYPYLSRRLLMDDSPRARAALSAMLTPVTSAGLDLDKLLEMADQFTSYSVSTSGLDQYAVFDGTASAALAPAAQPEGGTLPASPGLAQAQRELASVVLSKNASFAQKIVIDETARLVDASLRTALAGALDATGLADRLVAPDDDDDDGPDDPARLLRRTTSSLRSLPTPVRLAALPLTAPLEVAASAATVLAPLVKPDESDRKALKNLQTLAALINTTAAPTDLVDSLAKISPDGDLAALAADAETVEIASTVARRFGATLLRRAAAKLDHASAANHDDDFPLETRLSASAATALAEVYREAAGVIGADGDA